MEEKTDRLANGQQGLEAAGAGALNGQQGLEAAGAGALNGGVSPFTPTSYGNLGLSNYMNLTNLGSVNGGAIAPTGCSSTSINWNIAALQAAHLQQFLNLQQLATRSSAADLLRIMPNIPSAELQFPLVSSTSTDQREDANGGSAEDTGGFSLPQPKEPKLIKGTYSSRVLEHASPTATLSPNWFASNGHASPGDVEKEQIDRTASTRKNVFVTIPPIGEEKNGHADFDDKIGDHSCVHNASAEKNAMNNIGVQTNGCYNPTTTASGPWPFRPAMNSTALGHLCANNFSLDTSDTNCESTALPIAGHDSPPPFPDNNLDGKNLASSSLTRKDNTGSSIIGNSSSSSDSCRLHLGTLNLENPLRKKLPELSEEVDHQYGQGNFFDPYKTKNRPALGGSIGESNGTTTNSSPPSGSLLVSTTPPGSGSYRLIGQRRPGVPTRGRLRPSLNLDMSFSDALAPDSNIDVAADRHRQAAASHDATCTWRGVLPTRIHKNPVYSCKVFLGGVPWDTTYADLQAALRMFGQVKIETPGDNGKSRNPSRVRRCTNDTFCCGYLYVIFESDKHVKAMLSNCKKRWSYDGQYYYYAMSSHKIKSKEVQVIPWLLDDSNYVASHCIAPKLDNDSTIFVGALHGMLSAEGLAHVMEDLFGKVVYAGIDTDRYKYPIGSGRVTFHSHKSFVKAVNAAFVEIKACKFTKKVQIDPYLELSYCAVCRISVGPYFCRNPQCFKYYCNECWKKQHEQLNLSSGPHSPLTRNGKSPKRNGFTSHYPDDQVA